MWPAAEKDTRKKEFFESIDLENGCYFLAFDKSEAIGFAQVGLRHDYVERTNSSPVGYLEGIHVLEEYRGHTIAQKLIQNFENWSKEKGSTEIASDIEVGNNVSELFHLASRFIEVNRLIYYAKQI